MPEVKVASLMKQICSAVEVLHNSKIIHRDIKPENIVMHEVPSFLSRTSANYVTLDGRFTWTTK
jgi:serine/threonine protein kinase